MDQTQMSLRLLLFTSLSTLAQEAALAQDVTLNGHSGAVMMAVFAADDGRVVTASSDQTAKLWDAASGIELQSYNQHAGPLYCLAVSGDGRTLVTGAQDNTLRVWDLPLGRPIRRATQPGADVLDFAMSPDAGTMVAVAADHSVRLFDLAVNRDANAATAPHLPPSTSRSGHASAVHATAYRNDGTQFVTTDATGQILVWSPDLDSPMAQLMGHEGKVNAVVLPNNDQRLATAGDDGVIRVWQLPTPLPKSLLTSEMAGDTIALLTGQQAAVYVLSNGQCRLINLQTGEVQREFPQPVAETTQIAVSPTNAWFARANKDGRCQLINVNDASIMGLVAGHEGAINDVAVCQDGVRFATAGSDGTVRLWKQPIAAVPMARHTGVVLDVAVAGNGTWSLTISDDMTTRRWNASGAQVAQYGNHTQPLRAVAIRDDDAVFATGDTEGTVWVWDAANGNAQGVVAAGPAAITSLAFSSDRNSLITAQADGSIRSWTLPLPAQKPADGADPVKPAWEFKTPDGAGIVQLVRLSQEHGLAALTSSGTAILRLRWDGTNADAIASPGGVVKSLDVAANGNAFLATGDAGQIHVFEINGKLRKSMTPIAGLSSARFDRDASFLVVCKSQPLVHRVHIETERRHEELATPFPMSKADFIGEDQRSIVGIGTGNDGVLVQSALLKLWHGYKNGEAAIAISTDQQFLFSGGTDGIIRQWNLADANPANTEPIKMFAGHTAAVNEIHISANGQLVCAAGEDNMLRSWKMADASLVHSLPHPKNITSVSVSPDSTRVATGCVDGAIRIRDAATGLLLETFKHHISDTGIRCVRFLPDGQTLVSSGDDLSLMSSRTSVTRAIAAHTGPIRSMVPYNGGGQVITVGADGRVLMTNLANGNPDREYISEASQPVVVSVRPDSQRIAAGCENGDVLVWNANDGTKTLSVLQLDAAVKALAWSPDSRKLAVATANNIIRIFAPTVQGVQPPLELIQHQEFSTTSVVNRLQFAADSRSIWAALADGQIEEWAYAGFEQRRQFNHGGPVYGVAVTRDGSTIVSCSTDQTVRVWDNTTGQQKFQLNGHVGAVHGLTLSPDETFAVSSGADGTLRLWDIVGGRQLKQLITYDATIYSIAVHPQGGLIAAAGADRKVHLLDMITGVEQQTMSGHTDYLHSVTFSPDGSRVMSYGYAGQLKKWNTSDGKLHTETRHGRIGNTATYSPNGKLIITANGDGTASIIPSGF